MKNLKIAALFALVVFLGYFTKSNYRSWIGAKMVFVTEMHDFGTISEGDTAQYYIKFRNDGILAMRLSEVSSDCGCTVVDWSQNKISSGGIDSVLVEYDTNKVGLINRIVTFNSNSPDSPHAFFVIGNVLPKEIGQLELN
ncbi:MAG: hypothetical protein ACJAVN_002711 [Roseivirga sp.]|jgi:hypothetical protein